MALGLTIRARCCCGRIRLLNEPARVRDWPGSRSCRAARHRSAAGGEGLSDRVSTGGPAADGRDGTSEVIAPLASGAGNGEGGARRASGRGIRGGRQRSGDHRSTAVRVLFGPAGLDAHTPSTPCRFRFRARSALARLEAACRHQVSRESLRPTTSALQSSPQEALSRSTERRSVA